MRESISESMETTEITNEVVYAWLTNINKNVNNKDVLVNKQLELLIAHFHNLTKQSNVDKA